MGIRKSLASIAAISLVVSPVAAQAAPREAAPAEGEQLSGHPWIPIAVAFAVLAIILFVALEDNDAPDSP
jgi:hypothetical protein